jgi:peptide/nickel transport system ATP-binding protein
LFSAIPDTDVTHKKERIILTGDVPSPIDPGEGCRFVSRCFRAFEGCDSVCPPLREVEPDHLVACRLYDEKN